MARLRVSIRNLMIVVAIVAMFSAVALWLTELSPEGIETSIISGLFCCGSFLFAGPPLVILWHFMWRDGPPPPRGPEGRPRES